MANLIPEHIERHLAGLRAMLVHAEHLYRQGVLSSDDLEHARVFALEQRMGPLSNTESYVAMRENGDYEKYETLLNDPRSGTAAQREMIARKVAAHKIGEDALLYQPKSEAEQKAVMKSARERMATFVDMSGADADDDFAVYGEHAKLSLGEKQSKPVEEPSWSKPLQKIDPDDSHARDFRLRTESTKGTREWNASHDYMGVKRNARGEIISEKTLREDADRPKPKRDDDRGYSVDHEIGVVSANEMAEITRYESDRANDAAAAAEATPAAPSDPGPTILPNPSET